MNEPADTGRLWRRAIGIAAFVLFLGGLLVAIDLEEVVILAGLVGVLCAVAAVATWLLARYRRAILRGGVGAYRATAPLLVRAAKRSEAELRAAAQRARPALRRTGPLLRRADDELGAKVHSLARLAARVVATLAADIHAQRDARSSRARPRPRARTGGPPLPASSLAARRAHARQSAARRRNPRLRDR